MKIIIYGAGPIGLSCAAWLLKNQPDLDLDLYDRFTYDDDISKSNDSRNIVISYGSKLLLNTLNAWNHPFSEIHTIHISHSGHFGQTLIRREEFEQDALGYVLKYSDIYLALRYALKKIAKKAKNFSWYCNQTKYKIPELNSNTVIIHAEGGLFKNQEKREIYRDYKQNAIISWIRTDKVNRCYSWERFVKGGSITLLPHHQSEYLLNLIWCCGLKSSEYYTNLKKKEFLKALQLYFGYRAGSFLEVGDLNTYSIGLNAHKEIVKDNQVWIGNAAQILHPLAAQGLNLGLRDAYVLSRSLFMNNSIEENLMYFSNQRKLDRLKIIKTTNFLSDVFSSEFLPVIFFRGLALFCTSCFPLIKSKIVHQMMFGKRY